MTLVWSLSVCQCPDLLSDYILVPPRPWSQGLGVLCILPGHDEYVTNVRSHCNTSTLLHEGSLPVDSECEEELPEERGLPQLETCL